MFFFTGFTLIMQVITLSSNCMLHLSIVFPSTRLSILPVHQESKALAAPHACESGPVNLSDEVNCQGFNADELVPARPRALKLESRSGEWQGART
jgi:hypothetical protein